MIFYSIPFVFGRERYNIPKCEEQTLKKHLIPGEALGEMHVNGNTYYIIAPPVSSGLKTREGESTSKEAAPITPIITNAPGTDKNYIKDIDVAYSAGAPYQGLLGIAVSIKWDGNDAYFKNIITNAPPTNAYVKGCIEHGKLVMPMNQTVMFFTGDDLDEGEEEYAMNYGLLRPVFTLGDDGNIYIWYQYSDDYDSVSYEMDKDGSLKLVFQPAKYDYGEFEGKPNNPYLTVPPYAVGYYYNDDLNWSGWTGYCEWSQDYREFNYPEVNLPPNLIWNTFTYINPQGIGVIVYVAETEDAMYFKGLSAYLPDAAFKADKVSDNKVSIEPGQFIGKELNIFYVITNTGMLQNGVVYPAPENENSYFIIHRDSNGKITQIEADPDSQYFLVYDDDPGYFYDMDSFYGLVLTSQDSFAGTPSTPTHLEYGAYDDWMGANYIFFRLSPFANNGDIIDYNKLYYTIFVNGEPYEFEQTEGENLRGEEITMYRGIAKPTYMIPYLFANDVDLYEDNDGTFIVAIYAEGIDTIGVESVYVWNGETTYSQLVTIDTESGKITTEPGSNAGVKAIDMDDVVFVEYYDLQGRKLTNQSNGIFVKKYSFKDGASISQKVIVK